MTTLERRWADLKVWRLSLRVIIAPIPASAAFLALGFVAERPAIARLWWYVRVTLDSTVAWSILLGLVYLLVVTSWRRKIARWECLLLGAITGVTFPYAIICFRHLAPPFVVDLFGLVAGPASIAEELPRLSNPMDDILVACFAVCGLLGGWILWGIGVRAAAEASPDAAIFE